jgi:glycosyltransferase involved in cell wall biosynthesis
MSNPTNPKLTVLLVTYNHEKYIRQALDSVLMQKTDFDFEIVVADDHSQDSTIAIIEEYQADNHNIRILPSERNVGITLNYQRGFAACRGEHIAVLEGDDFWISPNKLRTVSTFLDQHPECAFCFHRFLRLDEASSRFSVHPSFEITTDFALFTAGQLAKNNFVGNFSACVYRREAVDKLDASLFEMKVYDWMFNIAVSQGAMIGYLPTILSVYRAHPSGAWSAKRPDEWRRELLDLIDDYNKYLDFKFDGEFQEYKAALLAEINDVVVPRVSVLLVTYNQGRYIRQALESALMQKANFEFEIVVADDHSDDSTLKIVREYQADYPNIHILPTEHKIGITGNYQRGFAACRGEYVAVLEGDDFWISPNKLELMSEFLDRHPECTIGFHRLIRHHEGTDYTVVYPSLKTNTEDLLLTAGELARKNFIGNFSTCMYRRKAIVALDQNLWKMKVREWSFNLVVSQQGPIGYVPEILSVYRAHAGGIWSLKTPDEWSTEVLELIDTYNQYLDFKFDAEFRECKESVMSEVRKSKAAERRPFFPRLRRWIEPLVPPILVTLATRIYHRAMGVE